MKKNVLTILLFILSLASYCQSNELKEIIPFDEKEEIFKYDSVYVTSEMDSSNIYQKIKLFITKRYKKDDLLIDEKNEKIITKGSFSFSYKYSGVSMGEHALFTMNIYIKNGKYRVQLFNIKTSYNSQGTFAELTLEDRFKTLKSIGMFGSGSALNKKIAEAIDREVKVFLSELYKEVTTNEVLNDW